MLSIARGSAPGLHVSFDNNRALTRDRYVKAIRSALEAEGLQSNLYSGHSFRIGVATTAAAKGVSNVLIKTTGRWESSAYTLSVRTSRELLTDVARQ